MDIAYGYFFVHQYVNVKNVILQYQKENKCLKNSFNHCSTSMNFLA